MKQINLHAKFILMHWLSSLIDQAEAKKISIQQVKSLLPQQTHIFVGGQVRLSAYSFKWVVKALKKLSRGDSTRTINSFTLTEVKDVYGPNAVN